MEKIVAGVTMAVAFLIMASVFTPHDTHAELPTPIEKAQPYDPHAPAETDWPTTDAHEGLTSLGTIEDVCYRVDIYSTTLGPRYSVYDNSGVLIATLRSAEQVAAEFPDLPMAELDFSTTSQLMYIDPAKDQLPH